MPQQAERSRAQETSENGDGDELEPAIACVESRHMPDLAIPDERPSPGMVLRSRRSSRSSIGGGDRKGRG